MQLCEQKNKTQDYERKLTKNEIENIRGRSSWFINLFPKKEERTHANNLFRQYIALIEPITRSQLELLSALISQEILKYRLAVRFPKDDNSFKSCVEILRRIDMGIIGLKRELGIIKVKKS